MENNTKKSIPTFRTGQIGINYFENVILVDWNSRWQQIDGHNDDGVDGLIFIERGNKPTGQVVYVQVKTYKLDYSKDFWTINVGKDINNYKLWKNIAGAAILILVNPESGDMYWSDINKSEKQKSVTIFRKNKFGSQSKGYISSICGSINADMSLPVIRTNANDFIYYWDCLGIKSGARKIYKALNEKKIQLNDSNCKLLFTKEGWTHLNRSKRPRLARLNSLMLLGVIERILLISRESDFSLSRGKIRNFPELVTLSALVTFPFRQSSVVKIIFRRRITSENGVYSYSFHTIYEAHRHKNLLGAKG